MLKKYWQELKKIELLSPEEETRLWQATAEGDEEARGKLIINYQPLVFKTAASFHLSQEQFLELVQEGMVGVIEAAERFDYARGVAFSLFAGQRIKGRMVDYLREYLSAGVLCLDQPVSDTDTLLDRLPGHLASPEEVAEENFLARQVTKVLNRLPEKEQKVLRGIYLEQLSPAVLARGIKVSQAHVYRLQKQGVRRLRGLLARFIHELKL